MPLGTGLSPCCCGGCLTLVSEDWSPFKPVTSRGGPSGPEEEISSGSSSSSAPGPWPIPADWTGNDWQVVWTTRDDNDEPIGFAACTTSATILFSTVPIDHTEHPNINARVQVRVDGNEFTNTEFRWWFGCSGGNDGYYVGVKYVEFVESTGLWKIEFGLYNYGGALVRPSTTKYVTDEYVRDWVWNFCLWEDTSAVVDTEDSSVSDTTFRERNITVTAGWLDPLDVQTYAVVGNVPIRDLGTRHGIEAVPSDGTRICVESYVVTESETTDCPNCWQDCRSCENDDAPKYLKVQFDGYKEDKDHPEYWCDCANRVEYYEYTGGCQWIKIPCQRSATRGTDEEYPILAAGDDQAYKLRLAKVGTQWRLQLESPALTALPAFPFNEPFVFMQSESLGDTDKTVKCADFSEVRLSPIGSLRPDWTCDNPGVFALVSNAGSDGQDPYVYYAPSWSRPFTFGPWGCNASSPRSLVVGVGSHSYLIDTPHCPSFDSWNYRSGQEGGVSVTVDATYNPPFPLWYPLPAGRYVVVGISSIRSPEEMGLDRQYYTNGVSVGGFLRMQVWPIARDAFVSFTLYYSQYDPVTNTSTTVPYGAGTVEFIP